MPRTDGMVALLVTDGMTQRELIRTDVIDAFQPNGSGRSQFDAPVVSRMFQSTPAAKGTNNIATAFAGNAASNVIAIAGQPAEPRNLRGIFAASYDGGALTIVGTDALGAAQTEVIPGTASSTQVGTKVFATVTSITKAAVGANAATATVGTGDLLGITKKLKNSMALLFSNGVYEAVTIDATNNAYTATSTPNGSLVFTLFVNV